jgi:hypothetical protein
MPQKTATRKARTTSDHRVIQRWAEKRGAVPSTVKGTGGKEKGGLLRLDFPGQRGQQSLQHISWDTFFRKFDEKDLKFLYQDKTATGRTSRFCKFIARG